jgi:hypothetical protein
MRIKGEGKMRANLLSRVKKLEADVNLAPGRSPLIVRFLEDGEPEPAEAEPVLCVRFVSPSPETLHQTTPQGATPQFPFRS